MEGAAKGVCEVVAEAGEEKPSARLLRARVGVRVRVRVRMSVSVRVSERAVDRSRLR